jgi:hypothetical protein
MGWYCVFLDNTRIAKAISVTFRNMLVDVYQDKGQPVDCHVYYRKGGGGHYYYFSPAAANVLGAFMKFWEGYEVSEPTNLQRMEIVI